MSQKFPLLFNLHNIKQDISVSIVTILLAGQQNNHRSNPGSIKRFFSSPKHPDSHWSPLSLVFIGYKELLPAIKLPGYEPHKVVARLRMRGATPPLPQSFGSFTGRVFLSFDNSSNSVWNGLFSILMHIGIVSSNTHRYCSVALIYAQRCKVSDDRLWGVRSVSKTLHVYLV
jgi:hypothetical protein